MVSAGIRTLDLPTHIIWLKCFSSSATLKGSSWSSNATDNQQNQPLKKIKLGSNELSCCGSLAIAEIESLSLFVWPKIDFVEGR